MLQIPGALAGRVFLRSFPENSKTPVTKICLRSGFLGTSAFLASQKNMSKSSGINGWSNPSKAKKAYLRRHNIRPNSNEDEHSPGSVTAHARNPATATDGLTLGGGLASISEQLYSRVTSFHAQIGSSATVATLLSLEKRLLDQAEVTAGAGEWEEAVNVFTHALAVTEKLRAAADTTVYATTQAAIVSHIGTCLHHLGEFEAAKAYYEEAITSIQRLRTPSYERWLTSALGRLSGVPPPDLNHARVQFLRGRLLDLEFDRMPEEEYHGEFGPSRWTGIARHRVRTTEVTEGGVDEARYDEYEYDDEHDAYGADGGEYGHEGGGEYGRNYEESMRHLNELTAREAELERQLHEHAHEHGALGSTDEGRERARVAVPPPSSSRTSAVMGAAKRTGGAPPEAMYVGAMSEEDDDEADDLDLMDPAEMDSVEPPSAAVAEPEPDWLREAAEDVGFDGQSRDAPLIELDR